MPAAKAEQALKELAELWVTLGKQGEAGVLRACTMTLVVLAEEGEDSSALGEIIAALMPEHPSRAVVVRIHAHDDRALEARVFAQCWMPFGERRQICCEQVEVAAAGGRLAELATFLVAIAASDLPVILWCRSPRLLDLPDFERLARIAGKLIVDSGAMPDAARALARIAGLAVAGLRVADLAWARLTCWRERMAHLYGTRERLAETAAVRIAYSGASSIAPSWSWYLAAWMDAALRAAGAAPSVTVASAGSGPGSVEVDGLVSPMPPFEPGDYLPLREELGIAGRDPVFENTLASATRLAVSS